MSTINNNIPFVPENTTDPAAGLNQALNVIDALLQIAVLGIQNAPPGSPSEGDRYIVSPTGTAEWAGHDNQLARWQNGAWNFYDARIAVNLGDSRIYSFDGTAWTDPAGGGVTALQPGDNVSELVNDVPYVETVNGETGPTVVLDADDIDDTATTNKFATQAQLDAADGALQAVNNLLDVPDAAVARSNLALGTFATYNYSGAPFINVMPDSGRFAGKVNPLTRDVSGFSGTTFFGSYNGSTTASAGEFIYNNTTHGGSAGALTPTVDSLITAMGRSGSSARYGVEFYVSEITAGGGTALANAGSDSVTRYLLTVNGSRAIFASGGYSTCSMWINVSAGSAHIRYSDIYVNGVSQPAGYVLPSGWNHLRVVIQDALGYNTSFPNIYTTTDGVVEIAVPAFFTGIVDTGIHTAPIPTINELSA